MESGICLWMKNSAGKENLMKQRMECITGCVCNVRHMLWNTDVGVGVAKGLGMRLQGEHISFPGIS